MNDLAILLYLGVLGLTWASYAAVRAGRHRRSREVQARAMSDGLMEPASLHPLIDASRCLGCGACVTACPEKNVLGLIDGRAELLTPANCIGHGACKTSCPFEAITLVLGTETRGVDIPSVDPEFQTNLAGMFVAGELGGMGLIRNAIEQGRQAIESVRRLDGIAEGPDLDVVIVGAGPAGFSASLAAMQHDLRFVTLEQETLGGTVAHYPRGKIVMTAPVDLPLCGKVKLRETTKEALLAFWEDVERKTKVPIRYRERVEGIQRRHGGFDVQSSGGVYRTRAVVLTIGRRGTPRKLGVPGEDLCKVVYRMIDPAQYQGQRVVVVGGGDSALEAAAAIAGEPETEVALSYRGSSFNRAKQKNRDRVEAEAGAGRLRVLFESNVTAIEPSRLCIESANGSEWIDNDSVIVCVGGVLPTAFLESIGIEIETKYGTV